MHHRSGDRPFGGPGRLLLVLRGLLLRQRGLGVDRFRRLGCGRRGSLSRLGGLGRLGRLSGLGLTLRLLGLVLFLPGRRARRLLADRIADAAPIRDAEHHHDEIRLLGVQQVARRGRPVVGLTARLDPDQPGIRARLAQDAELRGLGEGFLEAIAKPVGERVAEHHDVERRGDVRPARRRRRAGGIDRRLLALLVTAAEVTAEGRRARLVPLRAPHLLVAPLAVLQGRKALVDAALCARGLKQRHRAGRHHRSLGQAEQRKRGPSDRH